MPFLKQTLPSTITINCLDDNTVTAELNQDEILDLDEGTAQYLKQAIFKDFDGNILTNFEECTQQAAEELGYWNRFVNYVRGIFS